MSAQSPPPPRSSAPRPALAIRALECKSRRLIGELRYLAAGCVTRPDLGRATKLRDRAQLALDATLTIVFVARCSMRRAPRRQLDAGRETESCH